MKRRMMLLAFLLVFLLPTAVKADQVYNGGFAGTTDVLPVGWNQRIFWQEEHGQETEISNQSLPGEGSCLMISSKKACDVLVYQDIPVEEDRLYKVTVRVKADCEGGYGAGISVYDTDSFSEGMFQTSGEWEEAVLYGRSEARQTQTRIGVRMGAHTAGTNGTVYFDDFRMEPINAVPDGAVVHSLLPSLDIWDQPVVQKDNLLSNSDLTKGGWGNYEGWSYFARSDAGVLSEAGPGFVLNCTEPTELRYSQTIDVVGQHAYRVSAILKGTPGEGEAGISIDHASGISRVQVSPDGSECLAELFFLTSGNTRHVTLNVFAGTYSHPWQGGLSITDLEVTSYDGYIFDKPFCNVYAQPLDMDGVIFNAIPSNQPIWAAAVFFLWSILAFMLIRSRIYLNLPVFAALLASALAVRFVLCALTPGQEGDVTLFTNWALNAARVGPAYFYGSINFCDYPPLYIWLLSLCGLVLKHFDIAFTQAGTMVIRFWPIIFDLMLMILLYRRLKAEYRSMGLMLAMVFCPLTLMDGVVWGQADIILTYLLLLTALYAEDGKLVSALIAYMLAVLVKPQALLFGPLGATYIISRCWKDAHTGKWSTLIRFAVGLAAALVIAYAVAFISTWYKRTGISSDIMLPFTWLTDQLLGTMSQRSVFANNAANLYTLLGLNTHAMTEIPALTAISWGMFALAYLLCCVCCVLVKENHPLLLTGSTLLLLLFAFATQMTERYAFPGAILLLVLAALTDDWRICAASVLAVLLSSYNIFAVLHYSYVDFGNVFLTRGTCVLTILLALGMAALTVSKTIRRKNESFPHAPSS